MKNRTIANILPSETVQLGRTPVKQSLPTERVPQVSPFLLLHHFGPTTVEAGVDPLDVAPHPHRGFEPVTLLFSGGIRHKDSRGNEGILCGGDVQWMTAGRGIIHSERASREFLANGGVMEGIQLWVNLPRAHKMTQPRYQDIKDADIPVLSEQDGAVRVGVVAGSYRDLRGPAHTFSPILALRAYLRAGSDHSFVLPSNHNALIYILSGTVRVQSGFTYDGETLLHLRQDGEGFHLIAEADSRLLVLAGEPIDEPIAQWGPYVMSTQSEILEAMRDYQMGRMGVYVD